ncbi:MAG TPA: SGNH/GDSL hydrolase family protein [Chitinophagaceae bacterium]|nr:SGNH/GDSL hydrolase family protein [Chitinophagaceae bacterium]
MYGRRTLFTLVFLVLFHLTHGQQTDNWHGFKRTHFEFSGRKAWIVEPPVPLEGKPWIWNAHFPDWHTEVDSILLSKGFYVAYLNTNDMYGSPGAMQIWDDFHAYMIKKGFAERVALEGVSRGGLYVYNWAKRNPLKVACIYAEGPVCDFKSWPGGKGAGKGSPSDWAALLKNYRITEEQALAYTDNPINNLEGLAACKVPVFHAIGLNDKIVPNEENTFKLINNYIKAGGVATVYPMTRGQQNLEGHHYPIEHPEKIADFIFSNSYPVIKVLDPSGFHIARSGLANSYAKFTHEKKGTVAFMGGSITEHGAWRNKICQYLKERFPETEFEFINAGISSTGSTPGAFRLAQEVLDKGKIDLFFEEAAVNDATNDFNNAAQVRGMEGIIRHALDSNPNMDIVMMHFVDPAKIADYDKGMTPVVIANHEKVAAHYHVNTINLAKEITDRIHAGEFNWKDDFKDLHPSLFGHEVYVRSIKTFLADAYARADTASKAIKMQLPAKLDKFSYSAGEYVDVNKARLIKGWSLVSNWVPNDGLETRKQYVNIPALIAETPGSELRFDFTGTAIGLCVASGPDAGILEYSIDGGPFRSKDLYTQWSSFLHLPWYVILDDELKNKKHSVVVRIAPGKNEKSKGNACRLLHFLVNH